MSADLLEQLAAYGAEHRAVQTPIALTEVIADGNVALIDTSPEPAPGDGQGRGWVVAASVAAAAVLIVAGILAFRPGDRDPDDLADDLVSDDVVSVEDLTTDPTDVDPPPATTGAVTDEPVVPADVLNEPVDGEVAPTDSTPLPDFEDALVGDDGPVSRPLPVFDAVPSSNRLDFLQTVCVSGDCARDAQLRASEGGAADREWEAGRPFHIRHGFVNERNEPLPAGFDLAVYVFPIDEDGGGVDGVVRVASGPTRRFHSDYVVREETDSCGPGAHERSGTATCELFVHEFDDGLAAGRWALWAVWEAPCSAWIELGLTERCDDPDQIVSFFSSGVDSPYEDVMEMSAGGTTESSTPALPDEAGGAPTVTEVGDWTRVDGLGLERVFGDGIAFYGLTSGPERELLRSDDGIEWEFVFDASWWNVEDSLPAVRDGRLVAVDIAGVDGTVITVHLVEADGSYLQREVRLEGPPEYEPYLRGDKSPAVNVLENGRIVINTSYHAGRGAVLSAAPAILAERFGVSVDEVVVSDIPSATGEVEVEVAGGSRTITVADVDLEPWWDHPREVAIVSDDAETWTQLDGPEDINFFEVDSIQGGLVAVAEPRAIGSAESGLMLTSVDGVVWSQDPDFGSASSARHGELVSAQHRAFVRSDGAIWEATTEGAVLFADSATSPDLRDLFGSQLPFLETPLTAGGAGIAYIPTDEPAGIKYSVDDGLTWVFEPFPEALEQAGGRAAVGASSVVLIDHVTPGSPVVWVRELSG